MPSRWPSRIATREVPAEDGFPRLMAGGFRIFFNLDNQIQLCLNRIDSYLIRGIYLAINYQSQPVVIAKTPAFYGNHC
jgi:hypothetical protein